MSSPRPWGCFPTRADYLTAYAVFPTPVGVFPTRLIASRRKSGLPHARGGVSLYTATGWSAFLSSPRPWGCFFSPRFVIFFLEVFPTPVGVFLASASSRFSLGGLPHARGGVSSVAGAGVGVGASSPRPWGCFFLA